MKNNKLSFYFLVLLFSTVITSVMAQVSNVSSFSMCVGASGTTKGDPYGGSYTVSSTAGANRLLVAMVILEDNNAGNLGNKPSSVMYGGQEMNKVTDAIYNNTAGTDTYIAMYILPEAKIAAATDSNVLVAWTEAIVTAPGEVNCAIFQNVDQVEPIRAFASAANAVGTTNIVTIETPAIRGNTGDLVVSGVATSGFSATGVWAWENGFNVAGDFTGPGGFGRSMCSTAVGADADIVPKVSTTNNSQPRIAMVAATLKKFGSPALSVNDNQLAANAVNVYPNPASGILNIDSAVSSEKVINVINSLGQVVSTSKSSGNAQVDLKSLNVSGFVIVQVITNGIVSNHKVIVK